MKEVRRPRKRRLPVVRTGGLAAVLYLGLTLAAAAQFQIHDLGYSVTTQDIQADGSDTLHLVWTYGSVLFYGRIVGNSVSGAVEVATGVDTIMWRPYVSVQPDGTSVHVAWSTRGYGNMLMHSWKTTAGWTTEHVLTVSEQQRLTQATCAVDSNGVVHVMFVIWNDVPTNDWATIFYMRRLANGKWEPKEQFIPWNSEYKHPLLYVDLRGRVHATWDLQGRYGSDVYDAYYCSAPSGGKLSYADMVRLPKAPDCDVNGYGELYVDKNGVVHRSIGGWSNAERKMCLDHTRKPSGGHFETPTRASIGFLNVDEDPIPVVAANEAGEVVVAWGQIGTDRSNTVRASFYDPGKRKWSLYTVDKDAGIPASPNAYRVAIARAGNRLYLIWRGGNRQMKLGVAVFGEGGPPPDQEEPVAKITAAPTAGASPLTVAFDGSASYDPDGTIVSYDWDFGDGVVASGPTATHTYATIGFFDARLTVTDNDGYTGSEVTTIQVVAPSQAPRAEFTFSPTTGIFPCQITFDGSSSHDPDGTIVDYSWNFGDGSRSSGRVVTHTYMRWGTFFVSLTVTDDSDVTDTKVASIEILRLFQPLNIRWEAHKDESLFQVRYVNQVNWDGNPANDSLGVQITRYRIWRKKAGESDYVYRPIGEVTGDAYTFLDSDAGSETNYVYTVTAGDNQGHESPIVGGGSGSASIQPSRDFRPLSKRNKLNGR